jgi:hypothetical protein
MLKDSLTVTGIPSSGLILTPGARLIGMLRSLPRTVEVRHTDRVDRPVIPLNPSDRRLSQFHRGHLTSAQRDR